MPTFPTDPTRRGLLGAALTLPLSSRFASAQSTAGTSFPDRPIRLLVGFNAGGGIDGFARLLAPRLSALLGQQVVVENRSGAAGMIAADYVAKAPADGHTLMLTETGLLITSILVPRPGLDPLTAFAPVSGAFLAPLMIVASPDFPATDPRGLIALLKSSPGKYSFASPGVGSIHQLGFELLKARTGSFVVHIPYRGAAQIIPDVAGGQVPLGVVSAGAGLSQVRAGRIKAIGMMNAAGMPGAGSVPSITDALPDFDVAPHVLLVAPAGTPAGIVERLNAAMRDVLSRPDTATVAGAQGGIPEWRSTADTTALLAREHARWSEVITRQRIRVE